MFKNYKDLCDAVSLLVYCPGDHTVLLSKEPSGELWIPHSKTEKHCWKQTAYKMFYDLFGVDAGACIPIRVFKVWLPEHQLTSVYHAVYKVSVKNDVKKRTKLRSTMRQKLVWFNSTEMERQRAHANLRSPEIALYAQITMEEWANKEDKIWKEFDNLMVVEICEEDTVMLPEPGVGAVALGTPNVQLLQAAGYNKADQIRFYRQFLLLTFPAMFMSPAVFSSFVIDVGWPRSQSRSLFRAADITGRGGLTFHELLLWSAALEPNTQHNGVPADIRCQYIFRYFDANRDGMLEYGEFKELVAVARAARMLPVDALHVVKDADICIKDLGLQPNSQLSLSNFLRAVSELLLRGTSCMLRAPSSTVVYLADLLDPFKDRALALAQQPKGQSLISANSTAPAEVSQVGALTADYNMATYTVRLRREAANELHELYLCEGDAVSPSTAKLLAGDVLGVHSSEVLGAAAFPAEAVAAVHYFATPIEAKGGRSISRTTLKIGNKDALSWANHNEEVAMGNLLLKLADSVKPICQAEPRLLKLNSPVYVVGDLHGNLSALLALEAALWPMGAGLSPAKILFLGDFVDRGPHGTELLGYLLAAKLQRPRGVLLVRGNHECRDIQKMFTFHAECIMKYGDIEGNKIWNAINQVFDMLPLAALIDGKVFCCHGGIPPPWVCPLVTAIDKIPVPLPRPAEQSTIAWELLWNDPVKPNKITATVALELTANEGFAANSRRGTGHVFDQNALDRFLLANQLSHVVRAHELQQSGFMCQLKGRLVSVFSSSNYCGGNNDTGVALLDNNKLRLMRIGAISKERNHPVVYRPTDIFGIRGALEEMALPPLSNVASLKH